jgi:hypothetical protein
MFMEGETDSVVGAQSDGVRLAELITAWAKEIPSGKSLMEFRSSERKTSWWKVHGEAVLLMLNVANQVDAARDPRLQNSWNLIEPRLWNGIFATEHGLVSGSQVSWFTPDTLAILDVVVSRLDIERKPLNMGSEFQALRDDLLGLRQDPLITGLPDQAKEYVLHLLTRIEEALAEVAVTGTADVPVLVNQLITSLTRLFLLDPDQDGQGNIRNRIKRILTHLDAWLNSPIVAAIAGGITSGVAQITTGTP